MTKRKAIELALSRWKDRKDGFTEVEAAVENAYDLGVAYGMIRAERALHCSYPESLRHDHIRNEANELLKKARVRAKAKVNP